MTTQVIEPGLFWLVYNADGQQFRDRCLVKQMSNGKLYFRHATVNWNAHSDSTWKSIDVATLRGDAFEKYEAESETMVPKLSPVAKPPKPLKPRGYTPKANGGQLTIRIAPTLHADVASVARDLLRVSINQFVCDSLKTACDAIRFARESEGKDANGNI